MSAPSTAGSQRFPVLASARWLIPLAVVLGLIGAALARNNTGRLLLGGGAAVIALLWAIARHRRPVLIVDDKGYRVIEGAHERLWVDYSEIESVRAVPSEHAMYVDCGDPSRNLLLPSRHGYGFRFARQAELYVLLSSHLADKIQVADTLVPQ